jgi:hypothetical protein
MPRGAAAKSRVRLPKRKDLLCQLCLLGSLLAGRTLGASETLHDVSDQAGGPGTAVPPLLQLDPDQAPVPQRVLALHQAPAPEAGPPLQGRSPPAACPQAQ